MPLKLDIKRKLTARSDRVKCVDLHPVEPWMLVSLYNGNVHIWNYDTQTLAKNFEVCDLPVRAVKFIVRKNWVVTGSDDMQVRVFNYNTLEKAHSFEAHSDYVRCIAVHPVQPYILTSGDDMLIKLWNWEKQWSCQQVFEGHTHYVMQIVINPKDNNTFASASLDRTLKVWQLGSSTPNFTLEGHEKGVNCVDYYHGGDKPYLISGADDHAVKIWDYQNKTCVQTLEGHSQNVSAVCFHPELPIILTGSEDGTVRIWHSGTYRPESSLNYGLERVWTISSLRNSNNVAIGYDEGSVMLKVGREEPAVSMDVNGGKIIWAKHSELQLVNLKKVDAPEAKGDVSNIKDGEILSVEVKDMGSCEIYPQSIAHNPNGRFVVVCGDGEYIIYTAMALRNKAFGSAQEFVWAQDSSEYAIREGSTTIKVFKNFKEKKSFRPEFGADGIFGGWLLSVKSMSGLALYDWDSLDLIRRIEIQPKHIFWSESGELVCLATEESYFILRFDANAVASARENGELANDGVEEAFEFLGEVQESVKTGLWVGDCFIYTNGVNRINYYVGGEIVTISHLDRTMYLLGYVARDNRLYLGDKELNVVSYSLQLSVLEYQTAVMRSDFETADRILPTVPNHYRTRVAHFLEKQGFKQQALAVSTDPEHKFELAVQLGNLEMAHELAIEACSIQKWRQLGELATLKGNLELTQKCMNEAQDFSGLLLIASSTGDSDMIAKLAEQAKINGKNNISFICYVLLGKLEKCLDLLIETDRFPEAAFFARAYLPSQMSRVVRIWREFVLQINEKASQSLADPKDYENLFPGLEEALKTEKYLIPERQRLLPASAHLSVPRIIERNAINEMKLMEEKGKFQYSIPSITAFYQETEKSNQQIEVKDVPSIMAQSEITVEDHSESSVEHTIPNCSEIIFQTGLPISEGEGKTELNDPTLTDEFSDKEIEEELQQLNLSTDDFSYKEIEEELNNLNLL